MKRSFATALLAAAAALGALGLAPTAQATPGCQTQPWGFLGTQTRQICDLPIQADGSWWRRRIIGVPAHYANPTSSCSGSSSYSSCTYYEGGFVPEHDTDDETYLVRPDTVLPDEPPHLGG